MSLYGQGRRKPTCRRRQSFILQARAAPYVAINDVLSLKVARRDASANLICFGGSGTPATQFRWLHLHSLCGVTLFGSHQLHLPRSVWQSLVGPRLMIFVCDAWQRSMQNVELTKGG